MSVQAARYIRWGILLLLVGLGVIGYWLLPIPSRVLIVPEGWQESNTWPMVRVEPQKLIPGQEATLVVTDNVPWVYVKLTIAGQDIQLDHSEPLSSSHAWSWYWPFVVPTETEYEIVFYHDCHTGCIERTRLSVGAHAVTATPPASLVPTKIGVVFANPQRDWHSRSGWDVELTYALEAETGYWGIDDLTERVQQATRNSLRVLVRVDYARGQSLPPADDYAALGVYLDYLRRLARDDRLQAVYGYVIGSGFNTSSSNQQAADHLVTPEWYARIFNGYGVDPLRRDNVVETIRLENSAVRVLVGPVRPWIADQDGANTYLMNVPWLNYMNTLVAAIDASAAANESLGIASTAPDGFALQSPGRPDAVEFGGQIQPDEPRRELPRPEWHGAQAGFRVYRDWLAIINAYPYTQHLPAYITSTNTFTPDQNIPPAENYPRGWLTAALEEVNSEPQIQALCWFMDHIPNDPQWEKFRLTEPQGLLLDAEEELDGLLGGP
jgi:hypothetical protein